MSQIRPHVVQTMDMENALVAVGSGQWAVSSSSITREAGLEPRTPCRLNGAPAIHGCMRTRCGPNLGVSRYCGPDP